MTQEVQVTLTLQVDATKTKEQIIEFMDSVITEHIRSIEEFAPTSFDFVHGSIKVKEEAEIYNTELTSELVQVTEEVALKYFKDGGQIWIEDEDTTTVLNEDTDEEEEVLLKTMYSKEQGDEEEDILERKSYYIELGNDTLVKQVEMTREQSNQKRGIIYLLFGQDICETLLNEGVEQVKKRLDNGDKGDVYKFDEKVDSVRYLLADFNGYGDFAILTKEQYDFLKPIKLS